MRNKEVIRLFIDEAFNRGNLNIISERVDANYRYRSPTESMAGRDSLRDFIGAFRSAFPDVTVKIVQQLAEEKVVFTRVRIAGTHKGDFLGMSPTGKSVNVEGCVVSKIQDGLIVEEWELLDQLAMLQQLGAVT